jgi:hypothetical protein
VNLGLSVTVARLYGNLVPDHCMLRQLCMLIDDMPGHATFNLGSSRFTVNMKICILIILVLGTWSVSVLQ